MASTVTRWIDGLPRFAVGHPARVARVRDTLAKLPGPTVGGAPYDGVGHRRRPHPLTPQHQEMAGLRGRRTGRRIAMDSTSAAVIGAAAFTWLGMVLAISFLEAPLKFRAPGITVPLGLGIGRLVFRALNLAEAALALAALAAVAAGSPTVPVAVLTGVVVALLAVQTAAVRPALNRRSDRVLAGETLPRSGAHHLYVGIELVKVPALIALGAAALAAV